MIKYLGSKRALLPLITATVAALDVDQSPVRTVLDVFSGTARVGHALKAVGWRVVSNDHNAYAETLARCHVVADHEAVAADAERLLAELAQVPARAGWFTATYAERARYLHPDNAAKIEAMREQIARWALEPTLEAVLLTALMEASDRVDSTVGVQMAYLKSWAPRALRPVSLRLPKLLPRSRFGACEAYRLDALEAAALDADVAYLDPPYNQHSYLGNYHVWETLVRWDEPETFGVACKRVDVQQRRSAFNSKRQIAGTMQELIERVRAERLVVSFSDEGAMSAASMAQLLLARGHVQVLRRGHERYVGSKIGIYDPSGKVVGKPGRSRNVEHIFVVTPHPWAGGAALVQAGLCDDVISGEAVAAVVPATTSSRRARS